MGWFSSLEKALSVSSNERLCRGQQCTASEVCVGATTLRHPPAAAPMWCCPHCHPSAEPWLQGEQSGRDQRGGVEGWDQREWWE